MTQRTGSYYLQASRKNLIAEPELSINCQTKNIQTWILLKIYTGQTWTLHVHLIICIMMRLLTDSWVPHLK